MASNARTAFRNSGFHIAIRIANRLWETVSSHLVYYFFLPFILPQYINLSLSQCRRVHPKHKMKKDQRNTPPGIPGLLYASFVQLCQRKNLSGRSSQRCPYRTILESFERCWTLFYDHQPLMKFPNRLACLYIILQYFDM